MISTAVWFRIQIWPGRTVQTHRSAPRWLRFVARGAFCGLKPDFRTDYALRGRNRRRRTMYRGAQGTGDEQAMGVLLKTAVADLGEVEHAFDDPEGVLDLVYDPLVPITAVG